MNSSELIARIAKLRPGAQWSMPTKDEATVEDLTWLDASPKPTQAELDAVVLNPNEAEAKARLAQLDFASIRDLREWIAKQPDAPQIIKDREAEAIAEREKLKG